MNRDRRPFMKNASVDKRSNQEKEGRGITTRVCNPPSLANGALLYSIKLWQSINPSGSNPVCRACIYNSGIVIGYPFRHLTRSIIGEAKNGQVRPPQNAFPRIFIPARVLRQGQNFDVFAFSDPFCDPQPSRPDMAVYIDFG